MVLHAGPLAVIVGNMLLYRDENHITTTYASWLAPVMAAQLDALQVLPSTPPPTTTTPATTLPASSRAATMQNGH